MFSSSSFAYEGEFILVSECREPLCELQNWDKRVFPLTQSANPSTSPANRATVSPWLRLFHFYCHMVAFFFRLVGRSDALQGHMLDSFSVVFETGHSRVLFLTKPSISGPNGTKETGKKTSFPAGPCCDCKHQMHALVLRVGFLFLDF